MDEPRENPAAETALAQDVQSFRRLIAQAAALAVQDAAAHMRNINTITAAALGAAQEMAIRGSTVEDATHIFELAEKATEMARSNMVAVSDLAGKLIHHAEHD